ncbi:uncharacterized protein [Euwallacea fornicatus]|uniref:uncharacterized protein n=1 Tax=Euwallacea fornicatus TaxID=995702 RepID=UPI00338E780B
MASSDSSDTSDSDSEGVTYNRQIFTAVDNNDLTSLETLITRSQRPSVDIVNIKDAGDKHNSLLHIAVRKRNLHNQNENTRIIDFLVRNGANLQSENDKGQTPLHMFEKRFKKADASDPAYHLLHQNGTSLSKVTKVKIIKNDKEMDWDEAIYADNESHKASGLKLNQHGSIYQILLLVLFLQRAVKTYHEASLATEFDDAEKFDDVVLKYKKSPADKGYCWRFLQAKHLLNVETDKIKSKELFSLNKKQNLKFCLHKYFKSFCVVSNNTLFKDDTFEEFALCTNTFIAPDDETKFFVEDNRFKYDKILYFPGYEMQKFKLAAAAKMRVESIYRSQEGTDADQNLLEQFMDKFRLIVRYPDRRKINRILSKQMGRYFELMDSDLATNTLKEYVLKWFLRYKNKHSEFLLVENGRRFLNEIKRKIQTLMTIGLSITYPQQLRSFNIQFSNCLDVGSFLNSGEQILHVVSENPLLSAIKVDQSLKAMLQTKDSCVFVSSKLMGLKNVRNLVFESFEARETHGLLVITCELNHQLKPEVAMGMSENLQRTMRKNHLKKLILITNRGNELGEKLIASRTIVDRSSFESLNSESQTAILNKEVYFQGTKLPMKELVNENSASLLIDNETFLKLLNGDQIQIRHDEKYSVLDSIYINRSLSPQIIANSALRDASLVSTQSIVISNITFGELSQIADDINIGGDLKKGVNLASAGMISSSISWLDFVNGKLVMKQFSGRADLWRKHLFLSDQNLNIPEDSLLQCWDKVIIVAADPGMGKSSLVSSIHRKLHTLDPTLWILRINLQDYVSSKHYTIPKTILDDINFNESAGSEAATFISYMLLRGDEFSRKFLEVSLNSSNECKTPKVILIQGVPKLKHHIKYGALISGHPVFDGFDEVCPKHKDSTLKLLKALQGTSVKQIWVTTRPQEVTALEDVLGVAAQYLNKLSEADKFQFLNEYQAKSTNTEKVSARLSSCFEALRISERSVSPLYHLRKTHQIILDNVLPVEFTDNPMHLTMLLNVVLYDDDVDFAKMNLCFLYEKFKMIKFNRFHDEKTSTCTQNQADDDMRQANVENLSHIHEAFAFEVLFPDFVDSPMVFDKTRIARVGFISIHDDNVQFVHRSFAEYFVAAYLEKHCGNQKIQTVICQSVLYDHKFKLTRSCLNKCESAAGKVLKSCKDQMIRIKHIFDFGFYIIYENLENLLKYYMLVIWEHNSVFVVNLIDDIMTVSPKEYHFQYEYNRKLYILLHLLKFNTKMFHILFHMIMENHCVRVPSRISFNPVKAAFRFYNGPDIRELLDIIYEINEKQFIEMVKDSTDIDDNSILYIAAARGKFDYIEQFLIWVKSNKNPLTDDLDFEAVFLPNTYEKTFLEVMKYHEALERCLTYLFENFLFQMQLLLLQHGGNILRHIVTKLESKAMAVFLEGVKQHCPIGVWLSMVVDEDPLIGTPLHCSDYLENEETYEVLLKWCLSWLKPKELQDLLQIKNARSMTLSYPAMGCNKASQMLLETIGKMFDETYIKTILSHRDVAGCTSLHTAAATSKSSGGVITLLEFVRKTFGASSVKEFINLQDHNNMNILHHSSKNIHDWNMSKNVLIYCRDLFIDDIDTFKEFLGSRDSNGRNFLFHVVNQCQFQSTADSLQFLLNYFSLQTILMASDSIGRTILFQHSCEEVTKYLLDVAENHLDLNGFLRFLLKLDDKGTTAFKVGDGKIDVMKIFGPTYETLIHKLFRLLTGTEKISYRVELRWSEFDFLYEYIRKPMTASQHQVQDMLNFIGDSSMWIDVGNGEWILHLPP